MQKSSSPKRIEILFVDDEPSVQVIFKQMVQNRCPVEIDLAGSADEAISMLNVKEYDLIITDIVMPGLSGYDLASIVMEKYCTPVILATAYDPKDVIPLEEIGEGMICCIHKPFSITDIEHAVHKALRISKKAKEVCKANRNARDTQ